MARAPGQRLGERRRPRRLCGVAGSERQSPRGGRSPGCGVGRHGCPGRTGGRPASQGRPRPAGAAVGPPGLRRRRRHGGRCRHSGGGGGQVRRAPGLRDKRRRAAHREPARWVVDPAQHRQPGGGPLHVQQPHDPADEGRSLLRGPAESGTSVPGPRRRRRGARGRNGLRCPAAGPGRRCDGDQGGGGVHRPRARRRACGLGTRNGRPKGRQGGACGDGWRDRGGYACGLGTDRDPLGA